MLHFDERERAFLPFAEQHCASALEPCVRRDKSSKLFFPRRRFSETRAFTSRNGLYIRKNRILLRTNGIEWRERILSRVMVHCGTSRTLQFSYIRYLRNRSYLAKKLEITWAYEEFNLRAVRGKRLSLFRVCEFLLDVTTCTRNISWNDFNRKAERWNRFPLA